MAPADEPVTARRAVALGFAVLAATTAFTACGRSTPTPLTLAHFEQDGVDVTLTVTTWDGSAGTLEARFAPVKQGFHLYSVDLPAGGVEGLGVATKVDLRGGLRVTAPPHADQAVTQLAIAGLDVRVPVYPDGPVTTTVDVRRADDGTATAVVSYAACSASLCLPPVIDRQVPLKRI